MGSRDASGQTQGAAEDGDGQVDRQDRATQGKRACQGRAPVSHRQEPLRHEEGTLQGIGEEHCAALHALWVGESADRQAAIVCTQRPRCVLREAK